MVAGELGPERYQRRGDDSPEGYRNGYQPPRTMKTTLGPVELQRPKLRSAHSALCGQLFGADVVASVQRAELRSPWWRPTICP